ncbi:hypothetical protein AX17_000357 [Amanita inopinata Kibby_2008]|nr:hypothetical protein AX17_000357 [Amanita inopinata Kibby_2008]
MDNFSITLPAGQKQWRIDVPMRSFQGGYYPQLIAFYRSLGVSFRKTDFTYSFSTLACLKNQTKRQIKATMIYNGSSGFAGVSMPSGLRNACTQMNHRGYLFAIVLEFWTLWTFLVMSVTLLFCYLRTLYHAVPALRPERWKTMTFSSWADETVPRNVIARRLGIDVAWRAYTHTTLLPLFSAVCTASREDVLSHPVEEFLDYIWLTFGTHHYVVVHGVQDVISQLKSKISHVHLSSLITSVQADPENGRLASISYSQHDAHYTDCGFHHVIFATEANRAMPLLSSYVSSVSPHATSHRRAIRNQVECLSTFKYRTSIVLNHTDSTLLPDSKQDIRDLNLIVATNECLIEGLDETLTDIDAAVASLCVSPSFTMTTHIMTPPKGYPAFSPPIYQTTNPIIPPRLDCLLSYAKLERAVLTLQAKKALRGLYRQRASKWWNDKDSGGSNLGDLQGAGRLEEDSHPGIWICGSYAYPGIPLLEGCVVSSKNVVEEGIFGCEGASAKYAAW